MFEEHPDALKWNAKYKKIATDSQSEASPCEVLKSQSHLIPKEGTALDVACGLGGNALYLAQKGLNTHAWDISQIAIDALQQQANEFQVTINSQVTDLEAHNWPSEWFDCICVSYYLDRAICDSLTQALKPGGMLFYQTFCHDKVSPSGPSSPNFLLKNNELLSLFPSLTVRFYQHLGASGDLAIGDHNTIQMVAQKPD